MKAGSIWKLTRNDKHRYQRHSTESFQHGTTIGRAAEAELVTKTKKKIDKKEGETIIFNG